MKETRPVLQFRTKSSQPWIDVKSPHETYGRHGSIEEYEKFLKSRGRETRIIQCPIKRCPCCNQIIKED